VTEKGWPAVNPIVHLRSARENRMMALCAKLQAQPNARHASESFGKKEKGDEKDRAVGALIKFANGDDNLLAGFSGAMQ
jgi:phage terminase small subunit